MKITEPVKRILDYYESDNPGTKANLARILMEGRLGGTGKLVILPVDQSCAPGRARSLGRRAGSPCDRFPRAAPA